MVENYNDVEDIKVQNNAENKCQEIIEKKIDTGVQVELVDECWTVMWIEDWIEVEKMETDFVIALSFFQTFNICRNKYS